MAPKSRFHPAKINIKNDGGGNGKCNSILLYAFYIYFWWKSIHTSWWWAVARLVMQEWKDSYNQILKNSNIVELLSGLYVDDGRGVQRLLEMGERFIEEEKAFKIVDKERKNDLENERTREDITRSEVLKAMNSVNPDLTFTMELCSDFPNNRLPTLSFAVWPEIDGLHHTYYEKEMKNQTLLLERTSMSRQSLYSILSNEMRRRLETLDDKLSQAETIGVVDQYTQQLINSDFSWRQIREIIVSALTGHVRREKRRKMENKPKYRQSEC